MASRKKEKDRSMERAIIRGIVIALLLALGYQNYLLYGRIRRLQEALYNCIMSQTEDYDCSPTAGAGR